MTARRNIMITGGAGFIGSHLVRLMVNKYPEYKIVCVDALTYAGNLENLRDVELAPNYVFEHADVCDFGAMERIMRSHAVDGIIHLAAESHVDRSISDPLAFVRTNVEGVMSLLQAARRVWNGSFDGKRFLNVSTDEVFGALPADRPDLKFSESTPYAPHSPYSASKASADHFVRSFFDTYGLPTVISNCSNNYGPYQFPEKLIPLVINNIRHGKPLPVYGEGLNVRDWLYVGDHVRALDLIFHQADPGSTYCIGGDCERRNIDIVRSLIAVTDRLLGNSEGHSLPLITYVADRAGHDMRYAIDSSKLQHDLGWKPVVGFEDGLERTVRWYLDNQQWLDRITSGDYREYYRRHYGSDC